METQEKVGLENLSDQVLSAIVEGDIDAHGDLRSEQAIEAFDELRRRSE